MRARLLSACDTEGAAANGVIHRVEDLHLRIGRRRDASCLDSKFEQSGCPLVKAAQRGRPIPFGSPLAAKFTQ